SEKSFSQGIATLAATFPNIVGANWPIWAAATAGLVLVWLHRGDRQRAIFLSCLLACSFVAVFPGFYFREHYFVLMLPAIALLAGASIELGRRMAPRFATPLYVLAVIALGTVVVAQHEVFFQKSPLEISRDLYGPNPFPEAVQIAEYIRN